MLINGSTMTIQNSISPPPRCASIVRLSFDCPYSRNSQCDWRSGSREIWCGRRESNPHRPFEPCAFSYRLRLSPPRVRGKYYDSYYGEKRARYDDPKFHVSTPTQRISQDKDISSV